MTLLIEFTRPRKARIVFLVFGNLKSLTFSTLLGSAIMKSLVIYHPRNKIFDLENSHFITLHFAP